MRDFLSCLLLRSLESANLESAAFLPPFFLKKTIFSNFSSLCSPTLRLKTTSFLLSLVSIVFKVDSFSTLKWESMDMICC